MLCSRKKFARSLAYSYRECFMDLFSHPLSKTISLFSFTALPNEEMQAGWVSLLTGKLLTGNLGRTKI